MADAKDGYKVTCRKCRSTFTVEESLRGTTGKCPTCDAVMTFGTAKPVPEADAKIRMTCPHCKKKLTLPGKVAGKSVLCPACKEKVKVPAGKKPVDPGAEAVRITDEDVQDTSVKEVKDKRALKAWAEMQERKADSYWVAQLRSLYYPFSALGAMIFFVVGMPLSIAVIETVSRLVLANLGREEGGTFQTLVAGVVTAAGLGIVLAMCSFFASFLFALVRTSAEGREAQPVISGMNHKANLATFLMWGVVYSAPGLLVAYLQSGEFEMFRITPLVIGIWIVSGLVAPMGFLCAATLGGVHGFNPMKIGPALKRIPKEYGYFLLILITGTALFFAASDWSWHKAGEAFADDPPRAAIGFTMRLVAGLFLMFPLVIVTRGVGMLLKFFKERLPFQVDTHAEQKSGPMPLVLAFVAVVLIFLPLHQGAQEYMRLSGMAAGPWNNLERIHQRFNSRYAAMPRTVEDFRQLPTRWVEPPPGINVPRDGHFYSLIPWRQSDIRDHGFMLWIYTSVPVEPDRARDSTLVLHHVLLLNGQRTRWTRDHLDTVKAAIEEYQAQRDPHLREELRRRIQNLSRK